MAGKFQYTLGINELKAKDFRLWQSLIGEFLGNLILNFFACGACTQPEDGTFKALAFGLGVFMAITIIGHLSGGHVNPAVTMGMLVAGRISVLRAVLYIIFQCLGSIAGTLAVRILLDEAYYNGLGHTNLAANITELQGLGIEFFLGLVLVLTVFGACDANKPDSRYTAPLAIGMAVTLGHLGTIHYTGASMNPARTLGTAVATNNWDAHWVYWAGPILGGIAAALIYTQILEKPAVNKASETSDKYRTHADEPVALLKIQAANCGTRYRSELQYNLHKNFDRYRMSEFAPSYQNIVPMRISLGLMQIIKESLPNIS